MLLLHGKIVHELLACAVGELSRVSALLVRFELRLRIRLIQLHLLLLRHHAELLLQMRQLRNRQLGQLRGGEVFERLH